MTISNKEKLLEKCCEIYWDAANTDYNVKPWAKMQEGECKNLIRKRMSFVIEIVKEINYASK